MTGPPHGVVKAAQVFKMQLIWIGSRRHIPSSEHYKVEDPKYAVIWSQITFNLPARSLHQRIKHKEHMLFHRVPYLITRSPFNNSLGSWCSFVWDQQMALRRCNLSVDWWTDGGRADIWFGFVYRWVLCSYFMVNVCCGFVICVFVSLSGLQSVCVECQSFSMSLCLTLFRCVSESADPVFGSAALIVRIRICGPNYWKDSDLWYKIWISWSKINRMWISQQRNVLDIPIFHTKKISLFVAVGATKSIQVLPVQTVQFFFLCKPYPLGFWANFGRF